MKFFVVAVSLLALAAPSAAEAADRDGDRLPDRWEKRFNLSTAKPSADGDPDRDHVDNGNELRQRTNPRVRDTDKDRRPDGREDRDRDGLSNAAEDLTGNDPVDRDTDGDRVRDGAEQGGTVKALRSGLLTIRLARGGMVRGFVDGSTEMGCTSEFRLEVGRGKARRSAVRSSQAEDEPLEDEPFDDGPFADDESDLDPFEDDLLDDEVLDDEEDELLEEPHIGFENAAAMRACGLSRLRVATRVHQAKVQPTEDGLSFSQIQVLR